MSEAPQNDYGRRILDQLLGLRHAGALDLAETAGSRGVFRWTFRCAGWPVDVVLDRNVLELRVYHARDEVAMARVPGFVMDILTGHVPVPHSGDAAPAPDACIAALRQVVADWKQDNPRIFIVPPVKAGHPDNWNRA